jgi:hypothetical protein
MAGLYPLSRMQQFDTNGRLLSGARLFLFDGGTSTPRIGYRDSSLTSAHPNPILADSAGRLPLIYLDDGFYRHRLTTRTGTLVFDDDGLPVLSSTSGGSGTSVDPDSVFKTRDVKIRFDNAQISGFVRLNGKSIGSALSGASERANADTQSLYEELWDFDNITVTGGKGANAAADFAANRPLVLPDCQGRGIFGMPNMGGAPDSAFKALLSGTDTEEPGATGGADTVTLEQANIPSYSLTGGSGSVSVSGTTANETTSHSHGAGTLTTAERYPTFTSEAIADSTNDATRTYASAQATETAAVSGSTGAQDALHNHTFTGTGTASSISISSGGSGAAVNKLSSLLTFMIYVRL